MPGWDKYSSVCFVIFSRVLFLGRKNFGILFVWEEEEVVVGEEEEEEEARLGEEEEEEGPLSEGFLFLVVVWGSWSRRRDLNLLIASPVLIRREPRYRHSSSLVLPSAVSTLNLA